MRAITIARGHGGHLILLLAAPLTRTFSLICNLWEKANDSWKTRQSFSVRSKKPMLQNPVCFATLGATCRESIEVNGVGEISVRSLSMGGDKPRDRDHGSPSTNQSNSLLWPPTDP